MEYQLVGVNHGTLTTALGELCCVPSQRWGNRGNQHSILGAEPAFALPPCLLAHPPDNWRLSFIYIYNLFIHLFIWFYGCAGYSLLCGLFSSCPEQGLLSSCVVQASYRDGFTCCRAQAAGTHVSSRSMWTQELWFWVYLTHVTWDLLRLNPCLLPWRVNCIQLSHQGSPRGLLEVDGERELGWCLEWEHGE